MISLKAGVREPPFSQQNLLFTLVFLVAWSRAGRPSITITSWFREPLENASVGGAAGSEHLKGLALDLRDNPGGARVAAAWRALGGRVIDERATKQHWHLDARAS